MVAEMVVAGGGLSHCWYDLCCVWVGWCLAFGLLLVYLDFCSVVLVLHLKIWQGLWMLSWSAVGLTLVCWWFVMLVCHGVLLLVYGLLFVVECV